MIARHDDGYLLESRMNTTAGQTLVYWIREWSQSNTNEEIPLNRCRAPRHLHVGFVEPVSVCYRGGHMTKHIGQ